MAAGRSKVNKMWKFSDGVKNFRASSNDILVFIKLSGEERGARQIATAVKMDPRGCLTKL